MKTYQLLKTCTLATTLLLSSLHGAVQNAEQGLPEEMQKIMHQPRYEPAIWWVYAKDLNTGETLYDLNSQKLFAPGSTTKLFSIAALFNTFGTDYRFKTPVFATSEIKDGKLQGNLILVAQGDFTMGGRQPNADTIDFTKMDHTYANVGPQVFLTPQDPLQGLNDLAKQAYQKGLRELSGDVIIDDSLFETIEKRDMTLSPIIINDNMFDIIINPTAEDQNAKLTLRPEVPGYTIDNQVKTIAKGGALEVEVTSDDKGHKIIVKGTVPVGQENNVRMIPIKDPKVFARAAFIQALQKAGVKVNAPIEPTVMTQPLNSYKDLQQVALLTSPPLSEYAKLILKVSHNLGANIVPLLLASHVGKKSFEEGIKLIGNFAIDKVKLSPNDFVFIDGAGGNENRLSPKAILQLLEYMHKQTPSQFQHYIDDMPILGVDGSLEDFAKNTEAAGKVFAKPGTGVSYNVATGQYFLITQALGGYIKGKNGHLFAYVLAVNNAEMPTINEFSTIFEDQGQISSVIYNHTGNEK